MSGNNNHFEPRIIAFLCNWCAYTGADLAGTSRMQYPPNVRIVRMMCTGAIDPVYVIKALVDGADAVLIAGCHPGDCHYSEGNYKARRYIAQLKTILEETGFDPERIWLRWISASEGRLFAETVAEMTEAVRAGGPTPLRQALVV
jgi:F420-non-reducing hydrogenase iron-sulfur subunit